MLKFILILASIAVAWASDVTKVIPYHASIRNDSQHVCSGAIISNKWILTVPHKIQKLDPNTLKVVVGTIDITNTDQSYPVDSVVIYPYSNIARILFTFALVKVKDTIIFNEKVGSIALPDPEGRSLDGGDHVEVSGWKLAGDKNIRKTLQLINEIVFSTKECDQWLNYRTSKSTLCTMYDHCTVEPEDLFWDVGGPVVMNNTVVGLVFYLPHDHFKAPGFSAKVSTVMDWIKWTAK